MSKHKVSKWTRIAVEGATTDGRTIQRSWIQQMADQYSPNTYGARLNCEHIRGFYPSSEFGAYGDVVALKAEDIEIDGKTKLALFAQIKPNDALLELNAKGQKIFTSIEVQPEFADTGKAYLVGLAVTDTPASLGTEALEFSAKSGMLNNRKQHADNLFTAAEETVFEFVEQEPSKVAALFSKVNELLNGSKAKNQQNDAQFADVHQAVEALATHAQEQAEELTQEKTARQTLSADLEALQKQFNELTAKLEQTPNQTHSQRPAVTGQATQQKAGF